MLFAIKAEVSGPQAETRPGTELSFNFYRQATNKIAGISDEAAAFLRGFFEATDFGSTRKPRRLMHNPAARERSQ